MDYKPWKHRGVETRVRKKKCTVCGAEFLTRTGNRKYCQEHSSYIKYSGVGRADHEIHYVPDPEPPAPLEPPTDEPQGGNND